MGDMAKGVIIGVIVAILMLGLLLESQGILFPPPKPPPPPTIGLAVAQLAPESGDAFGEDLTDAPVPGSAGYDLCFGALRVLRPSMITTDMPDSFCTLRRSDDGQWLVSTGGWQSCQVSCVKASQ